MAPIYKPLAVTQAAMPPIIQDVFNRQFPDFEKDLATQQALDAQSMQNEVNRIKADEAKRRQEEDAKLREALVQQYGGENQVFNSDEALSTAQRIALQQGDLDTALNVEKIQDSRLNYRPIDAGQKALYEQELGYELPEGMTTQDINALINLRGKNIYGKSVEETIAKREDQNERLLPEGWEGNPTNDDSRKFKTTLLGTKRVNGILDALSESLSRTGVNQATGADYVIQRQLVGDLALELKSPAFGNLGAALSPSEYQLLLTQLPALLASPETSLGKVLVERGMGRDPLEAISALKNKMERNLDIEAGIRNFKRKQEQQAAQPLAQSYDQTKIPVAPQSAKTPYAPPGSTVLGVDPATGLAIVRKK